MVLLFNGQYTHEGDVENRSDSDTDSQAHLSDDEDIFNMQSVDMKSLPARYRDSKLAKIRLAVEEVCGMLRDDPLLPLQPGSQNIVLEDVDTPLLWPSWHCPFRDCAACGVTRFKSTKQRPNPDQNSILPATNSIREAWLHIWGCTRDLNYGKHRMQLARVVDPKFPEVIRLESRREAIALTVLEEAVAEKCRASVERVGMGRDRRTLNVMQEIVQSDNCKTLMCFICSSKHVYYHGLDAFGQEYNAGCIDYRNSDLDRGKLRSIFASGKEEESIFAVNLCAKRFKKNYGPAVEKDAHLFQEGCTEWRRSVAVGREIYGEALCNPQDVVRSSNCTHDSADTVCSSCSIPVCNECWKYATRSEDIPKALCNDNFIGYLRIFLGA